MDRLAADGEVIPNPNASEPVSGYTRCVKTGHSQQIDRETSEQTDVQRPYPNKYTAILMIGV